MKGLALLVVFLIFVAGCAQEKQPEPVFCTEDAKLCPDGKTYVSRIPPACEFEQCPESEETETKGELIHVEPYWVDNNFLNFRNKKNMYYNIDLDELIYKEGMDVVDFNIKKGNSFVIAAGKTNYVLKYKDFNAVKKTIVFEELSTGENISVFFTAIYDAGAMFLGGSFKEIKVDVGGRIGDEFRVFTSKTGDRLYFEDLGKKPSQKVTYADLIRYYALGNTVLEIGGRNFTIYVANLAGNPLAIDMDGDGNINGKDIQITTLDGTVFSISSIS